jgi:Flp pilus assembly protein TadG
MYSKRPARSPEGSSGVVAVEFLVILPLLLTLVFGIIEFGAVFNAQISLTQSVREGVRVGAIGNARTVANMQTRMQATYTGVGGPPVAVAPSAGCGTAAFNTGSAVLVGEMTYSTPIGQFGPFTLRSRAEMRCGG